MIDLTRLPPRAMVDTGVLIRALGQRASDPRASLCKEFWDQMLRLGREILISAPTVTEVSRSSKFPPLPIPSVRNVTVVGFDRRAAMILAEKFPDQVLRAQAGSLPIDYIRYDALILACAIRYEATLVTLDGPLTSIAASGGVKCEKVDAFQTQLGLFSVVTTPATETEANPPAETQTE